MNGQKRKPQFALDDSRIERAGELAKAALAALRSGGHSDGCVCNLCQAARLLLAAVGQLGVVEAQTLAEALTNALWPGQLKLPLKRSESNEGE